MKIALIGFGKMGKAIEEIAVQRGHSVVVKIDENNVSDFTQANMSKADVAIEFTSPHSALDNIKKALGFGVALVCGSTGWTENILAVKKQVQGALHRGRIDLLEERLRLDPALLNRSVPFEEIFPPELRCHDEVLATHGTPLAGASLLHMAIDFDEWEIFLWLLEHGADVDFRAEINSEGFGGHTPLFATVVSQPNFWMNYQGRAQVAPFAELEKAVAAMK